MELSKTELYHLDHALYLLINKRWGFAEYVMQKDSRRGDGTRFTKEDIDEAFADIKEVEALKLKIQNEYEKMDV